MRFQEFKLNEKMSPADALALAKPNATASDLLKAMGYDTPGTSSKINTNTNTDDLEADAGIIALQKDLAKAGADLGPFGPKGDGIDGLLGPYTRKAAEKFPEIAKKYKATLAQSDASSAPGMGQGGPIVGKQQSSKYYVDPKEIAQYLHSKGLDKNSIAGMLANAKAESSFNAGVYVANDVNGPGGGLFGFHDTFDGRVHNFTDMVNACGGEGKWQGNWQGQLDYALQASKYPKKGFATPGDAAEWFVRNYERPANVNHQAAIRSRDASRYA